MNWIKNLNKTELEHFRYATNGDMTLRTFKHNREEQHQLDPTQEVCYDCRSIALKLGIEV